MASALSEEEFQRLQTQFIDLKSQNYSLEDTCRKQHNELTFLKQKIEELEKELNKAQRPNALPFDPWKLTLTRSKKAREVEQLLQDNENLQRKLESQEEEFRIQNATLMDELSMVIANNGKLEKELTLLKSGKESSKEETSGRGDLRRLQAENAVLQKSLAEMQKKYESQVAGLKADIRKYLEDSSEPEDEVPQCTELHDGSTKRSSAQSGRRSSLKGLLQDAETRNEELRSQIQELASVTLKLDTEREEKKLLMEQYSQLEKQSKEQEDKWKEELNRLHDKLKKKQDSIKILQEEKELMYSENKKALEKLQEAKDSEIHQLQDMVQRLQSQVDKMLQAPPPTPVQESPEKHPDGSPTEVNQDQNGLHPSLAIECLQEEKASLESALAEMKISLDHWQNGNELLASQLEESQVTIAKQKEELIRLEEEKKKLESSLVESAKLAEKRKALVEEMRCHIEDQQENHIAEIEKAKSSYTKQLETLHDELEAEQEKTKRLHKYVAKVDELQLKVDELETLKKILEEQLRTTEENLESTIARYQKTLATLKEEQEKTVEELMNTYKEEVKDLTIQLEIARVQKAEFEDEVVRLKQAAKDSVEDHKMHEKKNLTMVKELKRQLQSERRRAEKFQEKLQEMLSESSHHRLDDIIHSTDPSDPNKAETSSISSWSIMSSGNDNSREGKEGSGNNRSSPQLDQVVSKLQQVQNAASTPTATNILEKENMDLVEKITSLQQEVWKLEEKVNHLEMINSAMAEDLIKKAAIIQHYCMEGRPDPHHLPQSDKLTVKKVVDFVKNKGDENMREINRRMQRVLEETLIKNMHLEKNLEALSNEAMHLRKQSPNSQVDTGQIAA